MGNVIPFDGIVVGSGEAMVNQASLDRRIRAGTQDRKWHMFMLERL